MPNDTAASAAVAATSVEVAAGYTLVTKEYKFKTIKDKDTGTESKRPPVTLQVPILSFEGLVESLNKDAKVQELVLNLVNKSILDTVRELISDEEAPVNSQADLDFSKIDIITLANLPPSEYRGRGIAKEIWAAWAVDYSEVMAASFGKTKKQNEAALGYFLKKLQPVKTDRKMLARLKELLENYISVTTALEDFSEIVEFLTGKIDSFLTTDDESRLSAL